LRKTMRTSFRRAVTVSVSRRSLKIDNAGLAYETRLGES
jgi:hypothetical protein